MSAAVGLGLGGAGLLDHPALSLGTSGTVFAASRTRPTSTALNGFAAADGTYLPLACTLNCTLAVDRVATLLGLDREDAAPGGEAVLLPYLDGERTPDLPTASGLLTGLRHDTSRRNCWAPPTRARPSPCCGPWTNCCRPAASTRTRPRSPPARSG